MRDSAELLRAYAGLVRAWAPRLDLVSPRDLARFEERHIEDSLRLVPLLDELPDGAGVDIGSGAGLPGVPLAIARPERSWTLVEPRKRRAAFLEEVVRELGLDAQVVAKRAEDCASDADLVGSHVVATARALTHDYEGIDSLARPLLAPGGVVVVFAGESLVGLPEGAELWAPGLIIMRNT